MKTVLLVVFGFLSGVIGGMGMGGGTLLVPLLSFLDLPQKTVQATNLVSFLPMCVVALCFHAKNKLIKAKGIGWLVAPACAFAVVGSLFAGKTDDEILRICFGVFLVAVGVWQLTVAIRFAVKNRKNSTHKYVVKYCANSRLKSK